MKPKRIGTLLSALLLAAMIIVPCVSAYQASSYGTSYTDGLDTTTAASTARSEQSSMGYSASYIGNTNANIAFSRMTADNVFFFDGHGSAGQIVFQQSGIDSAITASNPSLPRLSSYTSGELNDIALAVYMACNTANSDSTNGNLLDQSTSKGVDTAVGFSSTIYPTQSSYWSNRFWYYLDEGYNIRDAAVYATSDNSNNFGWWNQGGMNNYVIRGSLSSAIDPARAGY
ncbi:MAG: hypothetical protein CVV34_01665 [Methanomicrobiales archaeon HGW-Methanomicrobiales-5]|nr:MAG: hypothetical protein CVV34_01665 [Methanomicrobiales archaeon HGW-Methanomicrobiales-5]